MADGGRPARAPAAWPPRAEPAPNPLSGVPLDRAAERRTDAAWFAEALADPRTRVVPVSEGRVLVTRDTAAPAAAAPPDAAAWSAAPGAASRAVILTAGALREAFGPDRAWPDPDRAVVLLGVREADGAGVAYLAVDVAPEDAARVADAPNVAVPHGGTPHGAAWTELRPAVLTLPAPDAALVAYARAMVWWHARHGFCGACGGPTASAEAGHVRVCTRCDARHFPRTDPAVIVLVADAAPDGSPAREACLLGRAPGWPDGMYSTLAGFVEPGETLEEAVRREVREEAGVRVAAVRYDSSQPWPFPQSLMLGFTAAAAPGAARDAVRVDGVELSDARWFTRAELDAALAAGRVRLPPPLSIARRLIDGWRGSRPP